MKKKIIKSLKISSLLGFVSNNIKADYTLGLYYNIDFVGQSAIFQLKGDNRTILNDPTKCTNNFLNVVKNNKNHHDVNTFEDIKKGYVPVYYYVNSDENPKICSVYTDLSRKEQEIDFNGNEENVEEVVWVKKSDKKNIVTFCSDNNIANDIKSTKFLVDKDYIYNLLLKSHHTNFKSIDDVKKIFDININLGKDGNQNIEIIQKLILTINSVEFQILDKDVKGNDFITQFNNLKNLYIKTEKIENLFDNDGTIKKEAIKYIFEYKSKKYYIISDKKHNQNELFGFLKTKNNLKDKDLIFDPNGEIKIEEGTGNLVPGEYKIIEKKPKEDPKPQPQTLLKYRFTGVTSLSKWIGENFDVSEKVKVQSLFDDQDTSKYVFVAIKEGTNERFINNQIIEPGTYELKREEKPNEDNKNKKKEKGSDQGDPEKSRKSCSCC